MPRFVWPNARTSCSTPSAVEASSSMASWNAAFDRARSSSSAFNPTSEPKTASTPTPPTMPPPLPTAGSSSTPAPKPSPTIPPKPAPATSYAALTPKPVPTAATPPPPPAACSGAPTPKPASTAPYPELYRKLVWVNDLNQGAIIGALGKVDILSMLSAHAIYMRPSQSKAEAARELLKLIGVGGLHVPAGEPALKLSTAKSPAPAAPPTKVTTARAPSQSTTARDSKSGRSAVERTGPSRMPKQQTPSAPVPCAASAIAPAAAPLARSSVVMERAAHSSTTAGCSTDRVSTLEGGITLPKPTSYRLSADEQQLSEPAGSMHPCLPVPAPYACYSSSPSLPCCGQSLSFADQPPSDSDGPTGQVSTWT